MERRAPAFTILAITSLCAVLGLFESVAGVLVLTPFFFLLLPLLAGFDPAGPAVERLVGILGIDRATGPARPAAFLPEEIHLPGDRSAALSVWSRGPPLTA